MNKRAAELNPWFALLGGDLAYANGNSNEVGKWDDWLESWMLNCIRRRDGGLIPMVVAIGGHRWPAVLARCQRMRSIFIAYSRCRPSAALRDGYWRLPEPHRAGLGPHRAGGG